MSETSTPAGGTGGGNSTPARPELAELPAKVRVHALAKLLGRSSREVMDALEQLGEGARSAQSSVTKDTALQVADALLGTPAAAEVPAAAAPPATAPAKQPPPTPVFATASPLFLPPTEAPAPVRAKREEPEADDEPAAKAKAPRTPRAKASKVDQPAPPAPAEPDEPDEPDEDESSESGDAADDGDDGSRRRRRRGRRGRGRGKGGPDDNADDAEQSGDADDQADDDAKAKDEDDSGRSDKASEKSDADDGDEGSKRRRRRRRRKGNGDADAAIEDDPPNTVVHVRESRESKPETSRDEVRSVRGSTRLEAKRQRRRDGREAGRRRAPILSEAEFLARREAVDRTMVVRERPDRTQIAVLEDGVLVEHFVTSAGSGSMVGNVYLGRVQNVLPSMEAAFVDIGRGRNAVLYAGEVDWDAAGLEGKARRIEQALSTGDSVLVQVTKDPVGHKGARLTTQISLPGRFLVYVPGGGATGISRKLPENERRRLKDVLKRIVPEDAGVIIRTASEGVSEDELARDVRRLQAQWQVIKDKVEAESSTKGKKSSAPTLLYEEPDLLVKVVRDLFTEDFAGLVVQGDDAWDTIDAYVRHVAPELTERVRRHIGPKDVFGEHRIDEQLLKALDRKVWLPSGGYLVIDRTEAMTVIDVNTGKFTGSGGNLEETVTRNNLESAEEIVRQLRLRDIGGIIVIDFIDMVLEANRDLVLRRLTECLGRDRTRHQVAEVTSLGLVQMTRKRVGTGLLEAFSTPCEHCKGRGVIVSTDLEAASGQHHHGSGSGGSGGGGGTNGKRGGRDNGKKDRDKSDRDKSDRDKDQPAAVRDNTDHAPTAIAPTVTAETKQHTGEPSASTQPAGESAWTVPPTAEPSATSVTSTEAPADITSGATSEPVTERPASVEAPTGAVQAATSQAAPETGSPAAADPQAAAPTAPGSEADSPATAGSEAAAAAVSETAGSPVGPAAAGSEAADSAVVGSPVDGAEAAASSVTGSEAASPSATGPEPTGATTASPEPATSATAGPESAASATASSESAAPAVAGSESTAPAGAGPESAAPAGGGAESTAPAAGGPEAAPAAAGPESTASVAAGGPESATSAAAGPQSTAPAAAGWESDTSAVGDPGSTAPAAGGPEAASAAAGPESATSAGAGSESTAPAATSAESATSAASDWAAVNPAAAGVESATSAAPNSEAEAPVASTAAAGEEPTGTSPTAEVPAAPAAASGAAASADASAPADQPTARRRRHGKVSRPAGAPAPVATPVADVAVPPVPEGQSRVLSAPGGSVNGYDTQGEAGAGVPGAAARVDAPDTAALPRRHQPRRGVSRPAGPPVNPPGDPS